MFSQLVKISPQLVDQFIFHIKDYLQSSDKLKTIHYVLAIFIFIKEDIVKLLSSIFLLFVLCSCGSDNSTSVTRTSAFNQAYEQLQESAPTDGASFSNIATEDNSTNFGPEAAITNAVWANASSTFTGVSSTQTNPKGYLGDLFDASVSQSIFERARMPFLISCCLDILANKTGDLFTAGTQTVTFTSAVVGVCGSSSDFTNMIGNNITIVVTNLVDTTNYDQMIFFNHSTNPLFSDSDQWMYVRNNDTTLNFMHIEDSSAGFDGSAISVNSIAYTKSTEAGTFQYATKQSSDIRLYRILMDPTGDDARIFAYKYSPAGSNPEVSVNIASTFENQDYFALSMSWANQNAPYNVDLSDGNACIQSSDLSIDSDNTLTCAGNNKTALATSGVSAGIGATVQAINGATYRTDAAAGDMDDNLPTFTAGTILSAGLQL